jgi:hypothetical protein
VLGELREVLQGREGSHRLAAHRGGTAPQELGDLVVVVA